MVALMMLLRVPMADALRLSSKISGGCDNGQLQSTCFAIAKSHVSLSAQEFFASDKRQVRIAPEQALHVAANASPDMTT